MWRITHCRANISRCAAKIRIFSHWMSQGQVNDIMTDAQFLGFKNDRRVIPLFYDFPCKFIKIKWKMRRCGKKKLSFIFIFCGQAFDEEWFRRSKRTYFSFPKTVILQAVRIISHDVNDQSLWHLRSKPKRTKTPFTICMSAQPLPIGASGMSIDVIKRILLPWKPLCLAGKVWFQGLI